MKPKWYAFCALVAWSYPVAICVASPQARSSEATQAPKGRLLFQTGRGWSPRTNINTDTVMVYGIDDTTAERIHSWREHGYRVTVMTGVAWGQYAPYLPGDFDGKQHWKRRSRRRAAS
jgi:hypothetical protein